MNATSASDSYQFTITRDSFLAAISLFLRTRKTKKEKEAKARFYPDEDEYRIAWGAASIAVKAVGKWPPSIWIDAERFLAIAQFPPTGDPLPFKVENGRFYCGTWSCECRITGQPAKVTSRVKKPTSELPFFEQAPPPSQREASPKAMQPPKTTEAKLQLPQQAKPMTQPIRNILCDLDSIRENLLAFSDDVWLNINHNDTTALRVGIAFKEKLNTQLDVFGKLSEEIACLVREYAHVQTEGEASPETEVGTTTADNTRIIKELDQSAKHSLDEDFTYKRPYGFILDGKGYQDVTTWTRVYELILRHLAKKEPTLFNALPDNPATITRRDNPHFSRETSSLRKALILPNGIFAETNLSANHLCASIRTVLDIFSLPVTSCTIFLRQDRDA